MDISVSPGPLLRHIGLENLMTSEKELILHARQFDEDALAEVYDHYSPGLFRYAMYLLGDTHLAEDCLADTFLRYLQALRANGGPHDHLQAYLYRIAHNWITDQYRRPHPADAGLADELPDPADGPVETSLDRIQQQQVRLALATLTPDQRQVIVLKYLEGWENEAVAGYLSKPVGAIKALQHRALDALRRILFVPEEDCHE
jgi:RNA polymerase sigma-70 factor, ECF subfamily